MSLKVFAVLAGTERKPVSASPRSGGAVNLYPL